MATTKKRTGAKTRGRAKRTAVKARSNALTVVIDADEFDAAMSDPKVLKANEEATVFLERLEREGRSF